MTYNEGDKVTILFENGWHEVTIKCAAEQYFIVEFKNGKKRLVVVGLTPVDTKFKNGRGKRPWACVSEAA